MKARHTIAAADYSPVNILNWWNDSRETAKLVYDGIVPGDVLPQAYIDQWSEEAERRIVLAGYRIAEVMKDIYAQ